MKSTKKINKYEYVYVLQADYGYGWDDVDASLSEREMRISKKVYLESARGLYDIRIIQRRELNPGYKEG